MTSYPYWATPADLGTYPEGYSFTENPLILNFGESSLDPLIVLTVTLLNGSLPTGISWYQIGNTIRITGYLRQVDQNINYNFTFRISNGLYVADRTFSLTLANISVQEFYFTTSNVTPLIYYYQSGASTAVVRAVAVPEVPILYAFNIPPLTPPQGIGINSATGEITVDLTWIPLNNYVPGDYTLVNDRLYSCSIAGISSSATPPSGFGSNLVDTDYPAWQAGRYYSLNSVVYNDQGKLYVCAQYGYSDPLGLGPTGQGIGIVDGTCSWNYLDQALVWDQVTPNTSVVISRSVAASTSTATIYKSFDILLLSRPYEPVWITPSGSLPDAYVSGNWSYQLEAFDPDQLALSWSSVDLPAWLSISNVGLLYGYAPLLTTTTVFGFNITIDDGTSTSTRAFTITVQDQVTEFFWVSGSDLGSVFDGTYSTKAILAQTLRPMTQISYGLTGGMIPVGVTLDMQTGYLEGFVEFHGQDKTYLFDITATDGTDTLTKQFSLTVVAQNQGHFWTLAVPLLGTDKQDFIINNGEDIATYEQLYLPDHTGWGRNTTPKITVVDGIFGINALDLRTLISNYCHNFNIRLQGYVVQDPGNDRYNLISVECRDADSLQSWQPLTAYHKGQRVSNPDGRKYLAINSGVSGTTVPRGVGSSIADGSMLWAWEGVPNSTSLTYVLPWYSYRQYNLGDIIENDGARYTAVTSGTTGGGLGPELDQLNGNNQVQDGTVTWQLQTATSSYRGAFWPSNVYNIRRLCEYQVGWSNAWGTGANINLSVDFNGQIVAAQITNPGTGYNAAPVYTMIGTGSGADLHIQVGIVGTNIQPGSTGYSLNEEITVDFGNGTPAKLKVTDVSILGEVLQLAIVDPGAFVQIPAGAVTLSQGTKYLKVIFIAGLSQVDILNPGTGYSQTATSISLRGREYNASLQIADTTFDLTLPVVYVTPQAGAAFPSNTYNPYQGQIVEARLLEATIQGIKWNGYTRFDNEQCTFDEDSTRFVDVEPSTETTFDNNLTIWEDGTTTWDRTQVFWPNWSRTVFDSDHTIFDYYATLFDQAQPRTESVFTKRWLWWFGKPFESSK